MPESINYIILFSYYYYCKAPYLVAESLEAGLLVGYLSRSEMFVVIGNTVFNTVCYNIVI